MRRSIVFLCNVIMLGFRGLHSTCIVSHFAIGFTNNPCSRLKTQNAEWVFVSLCMYAAISDFFPTSFMFFCFFFFDAVPPKCCCVSGCLLTDNCKEVVFTGFTQAESSVLS